MSQRLAPRGVRPLTSLQMTPRDDRILPYVRVVACLVTPFLLVAFGVLYIRSELAVDLFAWPIKPRFTAMLLGAAYLGGAIFFMSIIGARRWHAVSIGLPPIIVFVVMLIATTGIHWNLFSFDRIAAPVWVAVYAAAGPLVAAGFWLNRRHDPGADTDEPLVRFEIAWITGAVGLGVVGLATLLFLVPDALAGVWPWHITPLSGRVIAAATVEPGVLAVGIAHDRRWSAVRLPLAAQLIALVAIVGATTARREDFDGPAISVALWWVGLILALAATAALLVGSGRARRSGHAAG